MINKIRPINTQWSYSEFTGIESLPTNILKKGSNIDNPLKDCTEWIGLELEIENIQHPLDIYGWQKHSDGSLRNNGIEYTSYPTQANLLCASLSNLKCQLLQTNTPVFSSRCSTHVHLNVQDLSWNQIEALVLLYSIFEKHFFNVAGTKRENNIFCVPLFTSQQLHNIIDDPVCCIGNWSKYNAINLAPILGSNTCKCFGTIEFRHLYGTLDVPTILNWVNGIVKLKKACKQHDLSWIKQQIHTLNTTSEYLMMYKNIFEEVSIMSKMSKLDFESCISNVKVALCIYAELSRTPKVTSPFYLKFKTNPELPPKPAFKIDFTTTPHITNPAAWITTN